MERITRMTLGERIRHVRLISGKLTLEQFGKRIGLTPSAISRFESGNANPSEQTLLSICREFGISEDWLKRGVGDVAPPTYESELEKLVKERGLSTADYILIRNYMALPQRVRELAQLFMENFVKDLREFEESDGSGPPKGSEEAAAKRKEAEEVSARIYNMILNAGEKASESGIPPAGSGIA